MFYVIDDSNISDVMRQLKDGDFLFYPNEYFVKSDDYRAAWYDSTELCKGDPFTRTHELAIWFNLHNFSNLDPRNWTKEEYLLFQLTWG